MARKDHQRVEFVLHKEHDRDLIDYIEDIKGNGSLSEYLRELIIRAMHGDINAQSDLTLASSIEQLRADQRKLWNTLDAVQAKLVHTDQTADSPALDDVRLMVSTLSKQVQAITNQLDDLEHDFADLTLRLEQNEAGIKRRAPTSEKEQVRETKLSTKLKTISFGNL